MTDNIGPYRLTILGAIVVLLLSVAVLITVRGPQDATTYLALIGSVAIPALLALLRSEQTANKVEQQHADNTEKLQQLQTAAEQIINTEKTTHGSV